MYLQLYQLQYITWGHCMQSFRFISALTSFHWWLKYTYTEPWCLWLPHKYWQNLCFCQQPANTNLWHWAHQTLLQTPTSSADYTVPWVLPWDGDQRPEDTREANVLTSKATASTARHVPSNSSCKCKLEANMTVIVIFIILKLAIQLLLQYSNVFIVVCIASFQTMVTVTVTV